VTRLPTGGRIDRGQELRFTFDGNEYVGFAGDTLASALLANGIHRVATSVKHGRPRGIVSAGVEEPSALVQIEEPFPEPMLTATTVRLRDGLVARGLGGLGRLAGRPDPARYDAMHAHCDVLVVGGGPTGLACALTANRSGARILVVDDQPELGGALLGSPDLLDGRPALEWVAAVAAELAATVRVLTTTTAFGLYEDGFVLALEDRETAARQRVWRIRAKQIVLATGAHERPVVFADNDRPGIMLAGAARTYLHRYAVLAGSRVVMFTTNDSAYAAAFDLADAGASLACVVDARSAVRPSLLDACSQRGIDVRAGQVVTGTSGNEHLSGVQVAAEPVPCDLLLVSGGWNPAVHLFSQARGRLRYDETLGAFVPLEMLPGVRVAGSANGTLDLAGCLAEGVSAGQQALGGEAGHVDLPGVGSVERDAPALVMWSAPGGDVAASYVDLQRDSTVADVRRAVGAGLHSVEHVKRYTTIGTAHDQGKTSGIIASGIVAELTGLSVASLGTTTFRPPYVPVSFAALAGRDRGVLHDPARTTPLHRWHIQHGAKFENVGQWKRPWYYPRPGEDLEAAVLRECRAAREGVALMDGSTLGKINVQGPDGAELLDRLYTNLMSSLNVGFARYGVMCGVDGMVLDDGTVTRVSDREWLLTTTTGNAAKVLEWMEEWLQTEWPHLQVHLTSVTDHWVTVPLVGPSSRQVLARLTPGLDCSKEAFPFMAFRDSEIDGVPVRVCRISFSGELAYEINVKAWYGVAVWERIIAAGEPFGITAYGTETMHVLRAEKGFPIIGQDTDGTITPQDLGMSWVVSKKKADFIGKRSFARSENQRPDRKHLVGLLPHDPSARLHEGAQILESAEVGAPPVPMIGHVTSGYRSAALRSTFGLALIRAGRERIGQTVYAWHDGNLVAATVSDPVLYDKEGARRDG
jgi:sarcosine oxidase, subunit alpha